MFGDGPVATAPPPGPGAPRFNEQSRKDLTADEVRFTTKGSTLYAFIMGWPEKETVIKPLGTAGGAMKVANVTLLGYDGKLQWTQEAQGLRVQMPAAKPSDHAIALKISPA
jgi:alpha-L-fucosidase